ncbi:hypothetical protein ElyMa_000585500 [Elysia marginata]|uniref:Fibrinogen C-terminal domain-containing protein n=1 Tax=Elysia marginata TaxID=1093978 RepID=A0AAV4G5Q8_9GAST|nr:hypothetical protein ElyMa_000585500 [Elysia marginata]
MDNYSGGPDSMFAMAQWAGHGPKFWGSGFDVRSGSMGRTWTTILGVQIRCSQWLNGQDMDHYNSGGPDSMFAMARWAGHWRLFQESGFDSKSG